MHIVMVLTNPYRPDPRAQKEAKSLIKNGYTVSIVCWDRQGEYPEVEIADGIKIRRIFISSEYRLGSRQIKYLPQFWLKSIKLINELDPDIIHCHDLDTTPIGIYYQKQKKMPWVYDAHECYPEQVKQQVGNFIYRILNILEKVATRNANTTITINELLAKRFKDMGGRVVIVENYFPVTNHLFHMQLNRDEIEVSQNKLLVMYIGGLTSGRAIIPLIESTDISDAHQVIIAGEGSEAKNIKNAILLHPNSKYIGWVPFDRVPDYFALADVIYYGLYATFENNKFSSPNTLFIAMNAGKPILTTNIGEIAQIVKRQKCGLVIDAPTKYAIAKALHRLNNSDLRAELGRNGRNSVESKYNWQESEKKLLAVYKGLVTYYQN